MENNIVYPSTEMIIATEARIRRYIPVTALRNYPILDRLLGNNIEIWVKHENHQPTNNFKVRNVLAALLSIPGHELSNGILTATTGNHGVALAWATSLLGLSANIYVPNTVSNVKIEAMRAYGSSVYLIGDTYDEALEHAKSIASNSKSYLLEPTNNLFVLAGAATLAYEIIQQKPDIDAMVLAIGGGSHAAGAITIARTQGNRTCQIFGVQSARAPAVHDSWHAKKIIVHPALQTIAEGLATSTAYSSTFHILREGLADFVTVNEDEIASAVFTMVVTTGNLVEGAGAVGLAGLIKLQRSLIGKCVAIIISGSNPDSHVIRSVFCTERDSLL